MTAASCSQGINRNVWPGYFNHITPFRARHSSTLGYQRRNMPSCFSRRKSTRPSLNITSHSIRCAASVRFLGVTIDNKLLWRRVFDGIWWPPPYKESTLFAAWQACAGATILSLKLNAALIISRIVYQPQLISPSPSECTRLGGVHGRGHHLAMEVHQVASNKKVSSEAKSTPHHLLASQALLMQLSRLGDPFAGTVLLRQLRARTDSHFYMVLNTFLKFRLEIASLEPYQPTLVFCEGSLYFQGS